MTPSRCDSLRLRGLNQHSLLQMKRRTRPAGYHRVVRHHQHGLAVLPHQPFNKSHDFVRTLAIQVAGGFVT